ncbi:adenylate kinase [bacterium]|nr:adenylate kinase [bacterium]
MKKILILLGPPGAGKGTVGNKLSQMWNLPLISSGDLLRENVNRETELGKKAKDYMEKGELVPDEIVVSIIKKRTSESDCENGFILDGFPRNLNQAKMIDEVYGKEGEIKTVFLNADDDFIVERLSNRRVCEKCGAIYHLINIPPKKDGICDKCGGKLIQREDDKEDVIRNRLHIYHQITAPLLEYYRNKGDFYEVDGEAGLDEIIKEISGIIKW